MNSPFHSIRWRLQVWHGLLLLLVVAGFCVTAHRLASDNRLKALDKDLVQAERSLMRSVRLAAQGPSETGASDAPLLSPSELIRRLRAGTVVLPASVTTQFQGREEGFAYFCVQDASGNVLIQSSNVPPSLRLLPIPASDFAEETRTNGTSREVCRSASFGLRTLVGRDITPELDEMSHLAWSLGLGGLTVWVLGLLGGWLLAGRALRPIGDISHTASRIAEGNLEERISTQGTDSELDQLSRVLNQTFERLHASFERQKQFTADASHELRTPLTILLSETQRILKRERSPEEYREVIRTCGETAVRMRHLVEALLVLARQESGEGRKHREPCDLTAVAADTLRHLGPLAAERGVALHADLKPASVPADPAALSLVVSNLLSNAIQHHHQGGEVHVSCGLGDGGAFLSVRDNGPGIAPADLPHLFERFYRADQVRTSTSGHVGLGLSIATTIVDNHGGTISVQSELGQGATFTVTLPLAP